MILVLFIFISRVLFNFAFVILENNLIQFQFNESSGALISLVDKQTNVDTIGKASDSAPFLNFVIVDADGEVKLDELTNSNFKFERQDRDGSKSLTLTWINVKISKDLLTIGHADVSLFVTLPDASTISQWAFSFNLKDSMTPISIWNIGISVPLTLGSNENDELFFPAGFGYSYLNPIHSAGGFHAKTYPGGEASMQFMAVGSSKLRTGVYMAALDKFGTPKLLQFSSKTVSAKTSSDHRNPWGRNIELGSGKALNWRQSAPADVLALTIVVYPPEEGIPLSQNISYFSPYNIAIGIVPDISTDAGKPLWSEAALIYRSWALENAEWTRNGPISSPIRSKEFPQWHLNNNIWINSHWQCHDIFNTTGGDPDFVLKNTLAIADRLEEDTLSFHWYEWQQGPDPTPEGRYLFDTHYPDYFPSRNNFQNVVQKLAARNISTFPYINGRIFDVNSITYKKDNGNQYCSKQAPVAIVDPSDVSELTPYVETYGSDATFCVANPFTSYWQQKVADTIEQLVVNEHVQGVYIDQIASAIPKLCWDSSPSHNHTLGGGKYWTGGYQQMMNAVQERLKQASSDPRPMVTENNAEPYMSMVQGYLTLNAYKAWYSADDIISSSAPVLSPAFPMIYGGYYVGFGAIWTRADFQDKDWWCTKLSSMFTTGSQLGWFSLVGILDDPNDSCGPMGVGDLLLDSSNDDLIQFLQIISRTRTSYISYFVHGHLVRPPILNPKPSVQIFTSTFDKSVQQYETVQMQAWKLDDTGAVIVALVATTTKDYTGQISMNLSLWDIDTSKSSMVVRQLSMLSAKSGFKVLSTARFADDPNNIVLNVAIPARSTLVIEILPQ